MTHTESRTSPSPRGYAIGFSISDLYRNNEMTAETRLDAERRMARKPATREMSSIPGSVMNVTEALKTIAAWEAKRNQYTSLVRVTSTHDQASKRADDKHRASITTYATFCVESLMM